ncbi:3-oxoacyl-[acyl-carrier-protein] synthase III C-terminal domain-containing protein [Virgibacillus pantothenticus]|uniref:3-oxoacyl-[acyl-carrier-protein] synthase III C-terminal domain-containing protein n=1 Tax=Virgibacillus pantothenticus TaxID=1473 RepID=UPI00098598CE|nr:3-oxoacyl-[acyl-carrier-protein] synthase III C-terminal domain-containing protein [Virgibacillus pantothenticus]GIP63146.1 3-oxoacyl-ACP synthase [Virgibacillus pantothenticus]
MTIGIKALSTYIPAGRQSVETILEDNGCTHKDIKLFRRIHKLRQVPIVEEGQKLEETLSKSLEDIIQLYPNHKIKLVLYTHTIIPQVPYNYELMYRLLKEFNLHNIDYYGISHANCASFFIGLKTAVDFLRKSTAESEVLIISGDQTNFMSESRYLTKSSIIGDSSAAMIISNRPKEKEILSTHVMADTRFFYGIYALKEEVDQFNKSYSNNLNRLIDQTITKANIDLNNIDWILPHNVNATTWRNFSRERGFDPKKIMTDLIEEIGHTYCTDAQINLNYGLKNGKIKPGHLCLLIGVGVGSFFGASVVRI